MKFLLLAVCVSLNALYTAGQETTDSLSQIIEDIYWSTSTTEDSSQIEGSHNVDKTSPDSEGAHHGHHEPMGCECVPYYQCDDKNNSLNTNGENLIDIRVGVGPCESYLDVCCSVKPPIHPSEGSSPHPEEGSHAHPDEGSQSHPDESTPEYNYPPNPPKTTPQPYEPVGCGYRNQDGIGFRITGAFNNEAQFGEFPWMIAVLKEEPCNCDTTHMLNVYQCGGSLISPKVVLTGAHCVYQKSPETLKIRAGEWDTQTKNELYPHHDRRVKEIIFHEEYYAGALHNDVALLILDEPLEYHPNVNVACLPKQDTEYDEHNCFATGWGKDVFGKQGKYQVILKKVELPIVPRGACQSALRKTRLGQHFKLHESFICAGGEKGKDTCKGDGGSPLVCPIKSKPGFYEQVGIVAWGIGCAEDGTPGVYVNVAKFRHWIDRKLNELNLDTAAYTYESSSSSSY